MDTQAREQGIMDRVAAEMTGWLPAEGGVLAPDGKTILEGWRLETIDGNGYLYLPDGRRYTQERASTLWASPALENTGETMQRPRSLPPPIIEGLLNEGEIATHSGGSKSRKTFYCMQKVATVAGGVEKFLHDPKVPDSGFAVTRKRVIYANCELLPGTWDYRIGRIAKSLGLTHWDLDKWLFAWQLKGHGVSVDTLVDDLKFQLARAHFMGEVGLIVLDSFYNFLGTRDECKAADMKEAHERLAEFAREMGDAAIYTTGHFPKGDASKRESLDRQSGSGVNARAPDDIVTTLKLEGYPDSQLYENTRRNFPSPAPFAIKFDRETLLYLPDPEARWEGKERRMADKSQVPELDFVGYWRKKGLGANDSVPGKELDAWIESEMGGKERDWRRAKEAATHKKIIHFVTGGRNGTTWFLATEGKKEYGKLNPYGLALPRSPAPMGENEVQPLIELFANAAEALTMKEILKRGKTHGTGTPGKVQELVQQARGALYLEIEEDPEEEAKGDGKPAEPRFKLQGRAKELRQIEDNRREAKKRMRREAPPEEDPEA